MHLAAFILLLFGSCQVSGNLCPSATFYITTTDATNPDCHTDCPCLTLDHLARNELPKLYNTGSLSLYILQGVHNSTVALNFVLIRKVVIFGMKCSNDLENPQTLIQLLSSNLTVSDVTILEIKCVAIDGGSGSVLEMEKHAQTQRFGLLS